MNKFEFCSKKFNELYEIKGVNLVDSKHIEVVYRKHRALVNTLSKSITTVAGCSNRGDRQYIISVLVDRLERAALAIPVVSTFKEFNPTDNRYPVLFGSEDKFLEEMDRKAQAKGQRMFYTQSHRANFDVLIFDLEKSECLIYHCKRITL